MIAAWMKEHFKDNESARTTIFASCAALSAVAFAVFMAAYLLA